MTLSVVLLQPPKPTTNNNRRQTRTPSKGKKSQKSQARNDTPAYIRTISRTGRTATPSRKKMEGENRVVLGRVKNANKC